MELKKTVKELIKWGSESKENKKEVVQAATFLIQVLNTTEGKITDKDLEKIAAGGCGSAEAPIRW